jgi:hypothetical protein
MVAVEAPLPATVVGLNATVAPTGTPVADIVTVPLNPFIAVTVAV